jgi:type IV pilus assembly protein PilF
MFRNCIFGAATLALALTLCACASSHSKEEALLHLQVGSSFLREGRYPDALRELLLAEKADPSNPVVQNNLGLVYFIREKNELAEKHLQRAVDLKSDYTDALNNHARVLIEMKKYDRAIDELKKVLKDLTYSESDKAYTNFGLAYFRQGKYAETKKYTSQAIRLNRNSCYAYTLFGRSQLELGEFNSAASSLDAAVALCKAAAFDEPHYFSGLAYDKAGDKAKAIARLEEVVRLYPAGKYTRKAQAMLNLISNQGTTE